jgi:two-component system sensor histidine kinase BaeS
MATGQKLRTIGGGTDSRAFPRARGDSPVIRDSRVRALAFGTALFVVAWLGVILLTPWIRFVVYTPRAKTGFDVTVSLLCLFVAMVLVLFPEQEQRERFRWLALGFVIFGVGGLIFGYLAPLFHSTDGLAQAMYCSLVVRSTALLAMAIGLATPHPPAPGRRAVLAISTTSVVLAVVAVLFADRLPVLARVADLQVAARDSDATLAGLTTTHWLLSAIPFGLAVVAAAGVLRHASMYVGRTWLAVAMVLIAGSQLHTMFWPSAFSPVLTTSSLLRLAFTLVVAIGAFFALRSVADERATVLAGERELGVRMAELSRLRADFTAMVAHELASPAAVLQGYATMLATGSLGPELQAEAAEAIRSEAELIQTLIEDVRAAASAEREDFSIRLRSVPLRPILAEAAGYGRSLPGAHPIDMSVAGDLSVEADPERIGQVLRNLVSNACRHTPPGTPVTVRAFERGGCVRIEVADAGPGIHPDDLGRIFEKFGRGRDALGDRVPGVGLGLYLSRRIIHAHGGHLAVESKPGEGATFRVELPATTPWAT